MARWKGSSIVFLKDLIKKQEKEEALINSLTIEEKSVYQKALAISWIDQDIAMELFIKTAKLLYSKLDAVQGLRALEKLQAEYHFSGFYNILLKVISIPNLIKQAGKIWHQYHDVGKAEVIIKGKNNVILKVTDYSDIPALYCEALGGYYEKMIEKAGGKNVKVIKTMTSDGCDWAISWN